MNGKKHHDRSLAAAISLTLICIALPIYLAKGAALIPEIEQPYNSSETPPAPNIVGGDPAPPGKYPYHVALVYTNITDPFWAYICGGTLIHPQWVITAAHCLQDNFGQYYQPGEIQILVGTNRLFPGSGSRVSVKQLVPHPDFLTQGDKDIALIRLTTAVPLGSNVQTIPMVDSPVSPLIAPGIQSVVTGWGITSDNNFLWEEYLREVTVPIVSNYTCQLSYNDMGVAITDNILCAGEVGQDACFFDSGGPLVVRNASNTGYLLVGIVSFGHNAGCGAPGKYGGYTRVPSFLSWITSTTGIPATIHTIFLTLVFK